MTGARDPYYAAPRIFTIDSGRPFLGDLARGLVEASEGDPIELAQTDLYLPNRRAARALGEAFIEVNAGHATLLPRIRPLGEADDEDALPGAAGAPGEELQDAVTPLERRLVLARFVAAARRKSFDGQGNWPAALKGADALAAFLESLYTEEADPAKLADIAPEPFAAHWRRSLEFLEIVTDAWPRYLDQCGLDDPARRRARLISRQAARLAADAGAGPIVVAGTTGSMPAVRRLLSSVAAAPRGVVVLPGLDRGLARDRRAWAAVDDAHPQAGIKILLESLNVDPGDVRLWPATEESAPPRARLLSVALRPADATGDWRERLLEAAAGDPGAARAVEGLCLVEAADEEEEAAAIAIAFRETLEQDCGTALLVTPDRNLARRVAAKMRRWDVEVYDSGGAPVANTACGAFLRLVAAALAAPDDAQAALALLRHPLTGLGLGLEARSRAVAAFDRAARGLAPNALTGGLAGKFARGSKDGRALEALAALAGPEIFTSSAPAPVAEMLAAHVACAEQIAATDRDDGATVLWSGEDGAAAAMLLAELANASVALGDAPPADYPDLFSELISTAIMRRSAAAHRRLEILGPLEARLQSAGLVILGGLNEGVWPAEGGADPFLSRAMRKELGLPSPERSIGLAAHDFAQGAAAPRVMLTRAKRRGGAPAKPSRWIVRLKNMLHAAGALSAIDASARYRRLADALDEAGPARPVAPPAPRPAVALRPRKLPVTQIETYLRDPYAIYARHVLGLRRPDPVAEPFGKKHLGELLHAAFDGFAAEHVDPHDPAAEAFLRSLVERLAPGFGLCGAPGTLWAPTIGNSLRVFLEGERARRLSGAPAKTEEAGETVLNLDAGPFTLTARADRIDILHDGRAALIDYKTTPPTQVAMRLFRMQLPLTALIVESGGFAAIGRREVASFFYLQALTRKDDAIEVGQSEGGARAAIDAAATGLAAWLGAFDRAEQPYLSQPRPQFVNDYGDYDLLARRREWSVGGGA